MIFDTNLVKMGEGGILEGTMAFNRSKNTLAVALHISKTFIRVLQTGRFHRLKSYGILGQVFSFIL